MNQSGKAIALCGATASGKSSLSMFLAKHFDAEIICMDSMQIYRGLDIGTAKPTKEEQKQIRHHMLDILNPDESYSVADYAEACSQVMEEIVNRGKIPFLVGGTGLYLKALMHGYQLGKIEADEEFRKKMHTLAETDSGKIELFRQLQEKDPASANKLHPNDVRRVIRALEVAENTGNALTACNREGTSKHVQILPIAIEYPREILYQRIEKRVYQMVDHGLRNEAEMIWKSVPETSQCLQAIGYKEWIPFFYGQITEEEAIRRIVVNTRHYAKRQLTFQRAEEKTIWLSYCDDLQNKAIQCVTKFYEENGNL